MNFDDFLDPRTDSESSHSQERAKQYTMKTKEVRTDSSNDVENQWEVINYAELEECK